MIQKTITKGFLIHHRNTRLELADEQARLDEMNENKGGLTSPQITGMPHGSGTSDPTSREALNTADLDDYVAELKAAVRLEEAFIEEYVRKLTDPKQKQVIRLRYLSCDEWDDVLFAMFGDKEDFCNKEDSYNRRMYGLHRRAIEELGKMTKDLG